MVFRGRLMENQVDSTGHLLSGPIFGWSPTLEHTGWGVSVSAEVEFPSAFQNLIDLNVLLIVISAILCPTGSGCRAGSF